MNPNNNPKPKPKPSPHARAGSSCAACKLLKRRCTGTCIFAPHFRGDELGKFATLHKVFGASNVSKILADVAAEQREDAVTSLVYEAEARLYDPVYGCIGAIALLQRRMGELQRDLAVARARIQRCVVGGGGLTAAEDGGCGGSFCEFGNEEPPFTFS